jgi:hypothetical protein
VNGAGAGNPAGLDDLVDFQGRTPTRAAGQCTRLVGVADVQGPAVGLAVHGHGPDAHFAGRTHHAQGNFAAVGHENLVYFMHLGGAVVISPLTYPKSPHFHNPVFWGKFTRFNVLLSPFLNLTISLTWIYLISD